MKSRRDTRQKNLVLSAVRGRSDHPTAEQIYEDVHKIDDKISKGTVYRNLNLMSESGEVYHVKVSGADRFDLTTESHYHIICLKCGKVIDAPIDYVGEFDCLTEEKTGYKILRHTMVFEGFCPDCMKQLKD